jgi:hypothetical protein
MAEINRREFLRKTAQTTAMISAGRGAIRAGKFLAADTRTLARVGLHRGAPTVFINDVPTSAYAYFFPVPLKEHVADFAAAGIHLYTWGWSEIIPHSHDLGWKGPNEYDYREFDAEVETILKGDPDAYLIPRLAVSSPQWWLAAHLDDRLTSEDGKCITGDGLVFPVGYKTSMASQTWLREASEAFRKLIEHVRSMPYANHVIGYQVTGGLNEWLYCSVDPDFSPAATQGFRKWLEVKYAGDVYALRQAWKIGDIIFESAPLPTKPTRLKADVNLLRDAAASLWVSDYFEFLSEVNSDALIHFCKVGKEASNHESILGAFYGYLIAALGPAEEGAAVHWGQQALRKVLSSPFVDFLCTPYEYTHRGPAGNDGEQALPETVKLHGKLFFTECDTPTYTAKPGDWNLRGRPVPSQAESFGVLKRDFSHRLIARYGMWWMDLVPKGGWYHHPDIVRLFTRTRVLRDKSLELDMQYKGEVAVLMDEETPYYLKPGVELLYPLYLQERLSFPRMGTTYDVYLHNDLSNPNMPDYKLYIFLDTLYLTEEERKAVKQRIQRDGKVAVWLYAPGVLSEKGFSVESVRDLTGIRVKHCVADFSGQASSRVYLTDFTHPITAHMEAMPEFGTESRLGPIFYCDDPQARTLGRLLPARGGGAGEVPGFVVKEFADWTSVYIAVPNVPAPILRNIARQAGCHIYNDDGDLVYANSHFLAIHTNIGGPKRLRLPKRTDVYDAFTEKLVARKVTEFTDTVSQYETRLYFLGDLSHIADPQSRFEL